MNLKMHFINMQHLRIGFLVIWHFFKRNTFWIIIASFVVLFLFFAQLRFGIFYSNSVLTEGFVGTYQESDLPVEVLRLISRSLLRTDEHGRIVPDLISSWEVNKGATNFKFKLKDNLKWSDGSSIKSSDFEFPIADTEISYPDDKTIEFKLKEAYSPFPSLLLKPAVKKNTLIGTGPYTITKIEKSRIFITKLTLKSDNKNLPTIYVRFYPQEKIAITGFSLGEVSSLFGISDLKVFPENPQLKSSQKTDYTKIVTVIYNVKGLILGNRSLRQALSFITPGVQNQELADNPYPHFWWAYNPDSKKYLDNQEEAQAALKRAKSSIPDDKLKAELILTSTPTLEDTGKKIADAWKKLGLDIKVRVEPGIPQNFQALLITQSIPPDPDQYLLWHTSAIEKTNLSRYSFARVDKDLEDGRKAASEEARKSNYFDFQKALLEDAPATFLYFPKYNIIYLKKTEPLLQKVLDMQLPKIQV